MNAVDPADPADVVVVGMGVGGEAIAGALAEAGLDVVGIEAELVGGECPYWACIPTKMMLRAGNLLAEARRIPGMAGTADVRPDWAPVAQRIREEATDNWDDTVAVDRFTGKGGRFVRGQARVLDPGTVEVPDVGIFRARRAVVLATGTHPAVPPIDGLTDTPFWTNREAVSTPDLPASLIVLGGGAVGVELAQAYTRFGVTVTVVEASDRLLPAEEAEASELLAAQMKGGPLAGQCGGRRVDGSWAWWRRPAASPWPPPQPWLAAREALAGPALVGPDAAAETWWVCGGRWWGQAKVPSQVVRAYSTA